MGLWAKSRLIFNFFRNHTKTSIRHIAVETGLSKRRVHRLRQALERRDVHPESWVWEPMSLGSLPGWAALQTRSMAPAPCSCLVRSEHERDVDRCPTFTDFRRRFH